jgi:hypothetical protein
MEIQSAVRSHSRNPTGRSKILENAANMLRRSMDGKEAALNLEVEVRDLVKGTQEGCRGRYIQFTICIQSDMCVCVCVL